MRFLETLNAIFSILWKLAFLAILVGVLLYGGAIVYGNFFDKPDDLSGYTLPQFDQGAKYAIITANTGNVIYTNSYRREETKIYVDGYWEVSGKEYVYRKGEITLDERTFGRIIIQEL